MAGDSRVMSWTKYGERLDVGAQSDKSRQGWGGLCLSLDGKYEATCRKRGHRDTSLFQVFLHPDPRQTPDCPIATQSLTETALISCLELSMIARSETCPIRDASPDSRHQGEGLWMPGDLREGACAVQVLVRGVRCGACGVTKVRGGEKCPPSLVV